MVLAAQKMEGFIVMKTLGIIPARYGSTRFEGKPLADICGSPMIEWVYKSAEKAGILSDEDMGEIIRVARAYEN